MKIAFCHMGAESLGLEYLSAVLKEKGNSIFMVFDPALFNDKYYLHINFLARLFDKKKILLDKIVKINPNIIAFTVLTDTYKWACGFAKAIKEKLPGAFIVFGGIHPTSVPELVIKKDFVDAICIGEGEEAFLELAENPNRTDIKNFWFKDKDGRIIKNEIRPLIQDLDSLPFADKSLFEKDISVDGTHLIATNRGCPFTCSYCFNNYFSTLYKGQKTVRQRSVKHVIDELRSAKEKYKIKRIYFVDDVFGINMDYVRRFFKEYREHINLPFKIISHTKIINDELIKIFKESGCFNVEVGIQSMCSETRRTILKRYETDETIKKAIEILERNKVHYTLHHIFGLPFDDYAKLLQATEFYLKLKYCTKIDCYWLSYFPKTEIVDISKSLNLIDDEDIRMIENGEEPMYFEGGSVRDLKTKRLCKQFDIFFQLIPTLPKSLKNLIYRGRLFNCFYLFPDIFIVLTNLINAVKNRDWRTFDYIKHYINKMKPSISQP